MNRNDSMNGYEEYGKQPDLIDISSVIDDVWKGFKRFWWLLLIIIIVCAGALGMKSYLTYSPYYTASATYIVSASSGGSDTYSNKTAASELGETMKYILTSKVLNTAVAEDLGLGSVPGTVSVSVMEDTNLFTISVNASDPQMADDILQSVIENYPSVSQTIIGSTVLELMDETGVPSSPSNYPDYISQAETGALVGVVISIVLLLIYALSRRTVKKEEDFKKLLNVECFGVIPKARFKKRNKKGREEKQLVLMDNYRIPSGFKEAIRTVRTRLERKLKSKESKTILITSAIPGEGKSTVAGNVALSLALKGKSVILVDMDLRNPSLGKVFHIQDHKGGTIDLLRNGVDAEDVLQQYKDTSLQIIVGGKPINKTSKILSSEYTKEIMYKLRGMADYVILDTPPCAILSDASIIAQYTDSALFVVRQDFARSDRILEGIQNLSETGIDICGCILNQAQVGITGYGYSSSYGYGRYGYGYGSKKYGYGYGGYGEVTEEEKNN